MSHRLPMHVHERDITVDLGLFTATIPDGSDASSTAAATSSSESSASSESRSSKSTKTSKDATTSETSTSSSSSFSTTAAPSTSSSSSSITSTTASITSTSTTSTTSPSVAAATTTAAASTSHSGHTSPGLVAFAVLACLAFVGALAWVVIMRRHHKQREWTFQQHQRIFDERFDKNKEDSTRPDTSHTVNNSIYPPMPAPVVDDGKAWSAGTGASIITTGPSVIRSLDWDGGPDRRPKSIIEAKPKRKPVPPPKEVKKKTFSQYLPYLLPQNHSAEVIELGKAQQQVYQKPMYKPTG